MDDGREKVWQERGKNGQLNFLVKKEMLLVTRGLCMLYSQWAANIP
jgi:hypothetical protein